MKEKNMQEMDWRKRTYYSNDCVNRKIRQNRENSSSKTKEETEEALAAVSGIVTLTSAKNKQTNELYLAGFALHQARATLLRGITQHEHTSSISPSVTALTRMQEVDLPEARQNELMRLLRLVHRYPAQDQSLRLRTHGHPGRQVRRCQIKVQA